MSRFLVRADGPDAPGIVAAMTGPIAEYGYSIEDTSTTRLGGHFAILLLVSTGGDVVDVDGFRQIFDLAVEHFQLDVLVEELAEDVLQPSSPTGDLWAITINGSDQSGAVSTVSRYLAELGANIEEMSTRIVGARSSAYAVLIDVVVPRHVDANRFVDQLTALAAQHGVSCDAQLVEQR